MGSRGDGDDRSIPDGLEVRHGRELNCRWPRPAPGPALLATLPGTASSPPRWVRATQDKVRTKVRPPARQTRDPVAVAAPPVAPPPSSAHRPADKRPALSAYPDRRLGLAGESRQRY